MWLPGGNSFVETLKHQRISCQGSSAKLDKRRLLPEAELMKKILMHAINSSWSHSCPSLYYLGSVIRDLPYSVTHSSSTLKDDPLDTLEELVKQAPDILCLPVYIWNRRYLEPLLRPMLSLLPGCTLVLGGPEATQLELAALREEFSSGRLIRITGPGELSFRRLAEAGFVSAEPEISGENYPLSELPFPYTEEELQTMEGKLIYYETSRGCPYGCIYCLSATDKRAEKRFELSRPEELAKLKQELDLLLSAKPRTLKFVDRSFNTDKDLAHIVWQHILQYPEAPVCHFEIYPDLITEEDIRLLAQAPAGLFRFEIGIQSTNPATLKNSGRSMNWPRAKEILLRLRRDTEVLCHCDLLIGLPGENYSSILNSIDEEMDILPHELQLGTLKILSDTPMHKLAGKLGYLWQQEPPYRVLASDALSFSEVCRLDHLAHIINLYWNKGEERELWREALKQRKSSELFTALMNYHLEHGIQFHSVAAKRRQEVLRAMLGQ